MLEQDGHGDVTERWLATSARPGERRYLARIGAGIAGAAWFESETATTEGLSRIDPAGAASFAANADRFKAELGKLKERTAALKARRGGESVAITEPVPLYLLDAAGLVNKTPEEYSHAIEAGQDVPVPVLQKTLDLISGHAVKMLAYNEQTEGPQTKKLKDAATAADVPVVNFTETLPQGQDYLQWMSANVDHIEKALQPEIRLAAARGGPTDTGTSRAGGGTGTVLPLAP
ncbi:zinc ABC transporter substrate-binding protein [Arthrobacter globiformis]|uniref:metal ABC transporter solute-binding protein, Zn/Mn family n=1 Tax=Arthrobacter globiformis TaxID=1665 RepID=UPI0039791CC7